MKMIRKKQTTLMAIIAVTAGLLHPSCEGENALSCSEQSCDKAYSPRFFVQGDVLYWKPHISGLELDFGTASISRETTDSVETFVTDEFDADPHFKWNAGYRLSAGYLFECSNWELTALWTHFQDSGARNEREDANTVNSAKCRLRFDQLDVVLTYNEPIGFLFNLKPFAGIRAAKIHESVDAFLVTDITIIPDTLATETRTFDDKQNYRAIGPIIGLQGDWNLGCGLGIYGSAAASFLYGKYNLHFNDSDIFTAPFSREFFSTNTRHLHGFDCNIDLALGISWDTCVFNSCPLSLKLGIEHHQYFDQSRLGTNRGDLTFDGGIFSIKLIL